MLCTRCFKARYGILKPPRHVGSSADFVGVKQPQLPKAVAFSRTSVTFRFHVHLSSVGVVMYCLLDMIFYEVVTIVWQFSIDFIDG